MKTTITLLIPENLDADAIIMQNPFAFYGQGLKKEMLLFICSELLKSRAAHRKEMLEKDTPFAPICGEYLRQVVHNYDVYLNFLLREKVFLTDNHFIEGEKCKGYCFNTPYSGQKIKRIEVTNYVLKKNLRKRALEWKKERKRQMHGYSYLDKWWKTKGLKIDAEAAFAWIEQNRETKLKELALRRRVKKRLKKMEEIHNTAEDFRQLVRDINEGRQYPGFSGRGHRFYNPISRLKRELRNFLTYNGQPLTDADIKNCQPFLLLVLLKPSFWLQKEKVPKGQNCLEGLDREMYVELRDKGIINQIITLLKSSEQTDYYMVSTQKYIDLVLSGGFYEFIQEHFQPFYPDRFDERQKVKKEVLRILYVNPEESYDFFHQPCQTFGDLFPVVHQLINLIKSVDHTYLPVMLQRMESFLVLKIICKEISRLHPHIPFFTIHDNIITTKGNEALVKELMQQKIVRWTGYMPNIGCQDLVPIQVEENSIVKSEEICTIN